jgi:prepilin-type N-terminal cleavage/methylation domain-containing protein
VINLKKTLKAFTLIELIIVMFIMTILLAGILQLFKPVRAAYQDAAYLENKRTVCNAISKYMTESLRYAQFIGAFTSTELSFTAPAPPITGIEDNTANLNAGAQKAAQELIDSIGTDMALHALDADKVDKIAPYMQVICIDYTPVKYNNQSFTGRIYRFNFDSAYNDTTNKYGLPTNSHMSFGADYYGANTYGISVFLTGNMLNVSSSTLGLFNDDPDHDISTADVITATNSIITSETAVELRNVVTTTAKGALYYIGDTPPTNGIPDMLESGHPTGGTLAASGKQYFFAFIPADKLPI